MARGSLKMQTKKGGHQVQSRCVRPHALVQSRCVRPHALVPKVSPETAAAAAPGNVLETQMLGPPPRKTGSETRRVGSRD